MIGLDDPPKHGVREAIGKIRNAGIKVVMITGDYPTTALSIARKINVVVHDKAQVMHSQLNLSDSQTNDLDPSDAMLVHGENLAALSEVQWDRIFEKDEIVFARTSPFQKTLIVKQAQGKFGLSGSKRSYSCCNR